MADRSSRKENKKIMKKSLQVRRNGLERPQRWVCYWNHVGLPDRLIAKVGVSTQFGGSGGAVSIISTGLKLNTVSATGTSFTYSELLTGPAGIYNKFRVVGCDLICTVSSKSTTPVDILLLPSAETTSPVTTTGQFDSASSYPHTVRRVLGSVGSGRDVIMFKVPVTSMQSVSGVESVLDETYDTDYTSGSFVDPTNTLYLYAVVKPTNGSSFTASTDPVFNVRGSLTVEYFDKAQV